MVMMLAFNNPSYMYIEMSRVVNVISASDNVLITLLWLCIQCVQRNIVHNIWCRTYVTSNLTYYKIFAYVICHVRTYDRSYGTIHMIFACIIGIIRNIKENNYYTKMILYTIRNL